MGKKTRESSEGLTPPKGPSELRRSSRVSAECPPVEQEENTTVTEGGVTGASSADGNLSGSENACNDLEGRADDVKLEVEGGDNVKLEMKSESMVESVDILHPVKVEALETQEQVSVPEERGEEESTSPTPRESENGVAEIGGATGGDEDHQCEWRTKMKKVKEELAKVKALLAAEKAANSEGDRPTRKRPKLGAGDDAPGSPIEPSDQRAGTSSEMTSPNNENLGNAPPATQDVMKPSDAKARAMDNLDRSMFLRGVALGFEERVLNCLIRLGPDPQSVDKNGQNALHIAAVEGHHALFGYLQSLGVSPNLADNNGDTPLHIAAKRGLRWVRYFQTENVDILAPNANGQNIAHLGKLPDELTDHTATIRYLLQLPQGPDLFRMTDNKGHTPLHHWIDDPDEVWYFHDVVVEQILKKSGIDLNLADDDGNTMFLSAAKTLSLNSAKCLRKHGCNPNAVNNQGDNALHLALRQFGEDGDNDCFPTLKFLISTGCDVNHKNNQDLTPLELAVLLQQRNQLPPKMFKKVSDILERKK